MSAAAAGAWSNGCYTTGAAAAAGIDHSAEVLGLARQGNHETAQHRLVRFVLGDACVMPFPGGEFSLVVSSNAFFFFDAPLDVLTEMHRVLAPGGRLVIATVPGPEPPDNVWGPAMRVYADDEFAALQRRARFVNVEVGVENGVQFGVARKSRRSSPCR